MGGLGCGITASLSRALYIENLIQKSDSTFYSPSFKDGCALGFPLAAGFMAYRTAEVIDKNSTKFRRSYSLTTELALTILDLSVAFTCVKLMNKMGYTYHPAFLAFTKVTANHAYLAYSVYLVD